MGTKKALARVLGLVVASGMTFAAAAYACTALATLNLSAPAGTAGSTVAVTGAAFATAAGSSPVALRWGKADGPVLAQATPDRAGNISANVTVPADAKAGYHVIVATQTGPRGAAAPGTPARAAFEVVGPGGQRATPGAAAPAGSEGTPVGAVVVTALLGVAGLALFGGGVATIFRGRRRDVPATARVRR